MVPILGAAEDRSVLSFALLPIMGAVLYALGPAQLYL